MAGPEIFRRVNTIIRLTFFGGVADFKIDCNFAAMKNRWLILISLLLHFSGLSQTYIVESIPDPKQSGGGYVSDPAHFLGSTEIQTLNNLIRSLEDSTTAQVAVVVVPSIGEDNPKEFTTRLFNHWGIGQAGKDNGLLIFTVMDQRRTEFETGSGLEGVLPDVVCYRVGMQELVPHFQEGNYGQGLIAALTKFKMILENPDAAAEISEIRPNYDKPREVGYLGGPKFLDWYVLINLLFHIGLFTWIVITLSSKDEFYDKYMHIRKVYTFAFIILFPIPYLFIYFALKKLLHKLREHPRFSAQNGKPMHKLSEEADDEYLEEGQITEEEIGAIDYDVWITDNADDILILRYAKRFSKYKKCSQCGYRTYFLAHSHTIVAATYSHSGKKEEVYECKNCNYTHSKYITIPRKTRSSGSSGGGFGGGGGGSWGGGSSGGGGAGVSW